MFEMNNNKYLLEMFTVNVRHGNLCWEIGVYKVKAFKTRTVRKWKETNMFDLYVSGSVYIQIRMHILLYYVCHAV